MHNKEDKNRLNSLKNERSLQIKRQGVAVELSYRHQILPAYLQCASADLRKLQFVLESKVSLVLLDLKGNSLMRIPKQMYFQKNQSENDKYRVYLDDKSAMRKFREGSFYILVKNNATIAVLSTILNRRLEGERYFHKIEDFINNDSCVKIHLEEEMVLEYEYQNDLNQKQNQAINKVFNNHLTFVKGPPGCGKTKTVSRMVRMLAERGQTVLVGSISNIANQTLINEIVRQVEQHNTLCDLVPQMSQKHLRLIINYSWKALTKVSEQAKSYSYNSKLFNYIVHFNETSKYHQGNIMQEILKVQKGQKAQPQFWSLYMKSSTQLTQDADIIISTTINSFKLYEHTRFRPNVAIMDQAAQASWPDTYGFLAFKVTRMVFVGDEKQLRPTVIGDSVKNEILTRTMFETLYQKNQDYFVHLVQQYRMHPKIAEFPNYSVYENRLIDTDIVKKQRQSEFDYFKMYPTSFVVHDFEEQVYQNPKNLNGKKGGNQYCNQLEGQLLKQLLFMIPKEEWKNVGILTFYDMQCRILTESIKNQVPNFQQYELTIKSIDGYQGGEKEYIFVSTVRCNKAKNPGFCNLLNRVNVALTRAKKGLIVFGNPDTLTQGKQPNDPTSNIWSKFYPFMLGKNQVLKHEQYQLLLQKINNKEIQEIQEIKEIKKIHQIKEIKDDFANVFDRFYQELVSIMEGWHSMKIEQDENELLEMNGKIKKQANTLINLVQNLKEDSQKSHSMQVNEKIKEFLEGLLSVKANGKVNDMENQKVDERSFKEKLNQLVNEEFTKKQGEFAITFIQDLSKYLYETMTQNQSPADFQHSLQQIKKRISVEQETIILVCFADVSAAIQLISSKSFSALKKTQIFISLVSSRLKYQLLNESRNEIKKSLDYATMNNKIREPKQSAKLQRPPKRK